MQAAEHVVQYRASRIHGGGFFDGGPKFVVDGLPIEARRICLPMFVAYCAPDVFERVDVVLALIGGELGLGVAERCCSENCRRQQARANHSFARTFAPRAPPSTGRAVSMMKNKISTPTISVANVAGSCKSFVTASI